MKYKGGTFIVTGATGGIGRAIVEGLIKRGVQHIVLACRNVERAERLVSELDGGITELTVMHLDLESFASVREFASTILERGWRIRALFNNAGTMPGRVRLTADGYEAATQVNYLATCLLTELLLPAVMRGGYIIFTTSMTRHMVRLRSNWAHRAVKHHNRFMTYARSKLMVTHYALAMSVRVAGREVRVNCSDPGIVDSNIITMGNRVVDYLSGKLFRPFIRSTSKGASPALAVLDTDVTSNMFTPRGSHTMNARYLYDKKHYIAIDPIRDLLNKPS